MSLAGGLYKDSLALLTDLYQLTMAYGHWKLGRADKEAAFNLFFRRNPFGGGFSIACGLAYAADFLEDYHFDDADVGYLSGLRGSDGSALFEEGYLDYLRSVRLSVDVDAVREGTVVFPHEPIVQVRGPILQCQLIETPLLNMVNFQTLIATKSARVCLAARGDPVLEFGLRRAQGIDGAVAASRAAYVGGCAGTSNVLAGKLFDIPVKGTHAHSWVMSFDTELESFEAYARAMPNNCVFLVDTYDTLEGVRNAVRAGKELRRQGFDLLAIRLDSGDLGRLSKQARKILNAGGFEKTVILASNDLDEHVIQSLKKKGATICAWGVGTRLATGHGDPALGGVYKLTAVRDAPAAGGSQPKWQYKLKLSEEQAKITTPGIVQVRRFRDDTGYVGDMIYDRHGAPPAGDAMITGTVGATRRKAIPKDAAWEDLLAPLVQGGKAVCERPPLAEVRDRTARQLAGLAEGVRRLVRPRQYPVGLERNLHELKMQLVRQARDELARAR